MCRAAAGTRALLVAFALGCCHGVRPGVQGSSRISLAEIAPHDESAVRAHSRDGSHASGSQHAHRPDDDGTKQPQVDPHLTSRKTWWLLFIAAAVATVVACAHFVWRMSQNVQPRQAHAEVEDGTAVEGPTAPVLQGPDAGAGGGSPVAAAAVGGDATQDPVAELQKRKRKILMEQAVARGRLERVLRDIADAEGKKKGERPISDEEIKQMASEALHATDMMAEQRLLSILAYALPLLVQGQRLQAAFESRASMLQENMVRSALATSKSLFKDIANIFDAQHPMENLQETLRELHIPSLAMLMSMALAPAQLRLLDMNVRGSIMKVVVFTFFSALVLVLDRHLTCEPEDLVVRQSFLQWIPSRPRNEIEFWFQIDFILGVTTVVVRLWVLQVIDVIDLDKPPPDLAAQHTSQAIQQLLRHYMTVGGMALIRLKDVYSSRLFNLTNWYLLLQSVWMVYGMDVVSNTTWHNCPTYSLMYLRMRASIFLVLLVPTVLTILWMLVMTLITHERTQIFVLGMAHELDEFLGIGFPLAKIMVQVLFVHSQDDIRALKIRIYEGRKLDVERRVRDAEAELQVARESEEEVQTALATLWEEKAAEDAVTQEQRTERERCQQLERDEAKERVIGDASKVVSQINKKVQEMSEDAGSQVERWQAGEGPEFVGALAHGRGLAHLQTTLGLDELDVSDAAQRAERLAASLQEQGADAVAAAAAEAERMRTQAPHLVAAAAAEAERMRSQALTPGAAGGPSEAAASRALLGVAPHRADSVAAAAQPETGGG